MQSISKMMVTLIIYTFVEQVGIIWKISTSMDNPQKIKFFNISDTVRCCGETGLLGLAFDPNFINNGYFYVDYTIDNPLTTRISRFLYLIILT